VMGDAMAHIQISTETIYDSAQRIRRLAHELLEQLGMRSGPCWKC
jgi:predicted ATP-grasp superfamily ATP-dependent carboligase